jgi:hypothetical protein
MDNNEAAAAIESLVRERRAELYLNRTAFAVRAGIDPSVLDSLDFTHDWSSLAPTLERMEGALDWKPGTFARLWANRAAGVGGEGLRVERVQHDDPFADLFGGLAGTASGQPVRRIADASELTDAELMAELTRRLQQSRR